MSRTAENSLWYKQKRPVVDKYLSTAKQVEDAVAGRGFLSRPGYLGGMVTSVERDLKFALSDINYAIMKDAVDRQLAQDSHDYEIMFKAARYAWELEKTQTLTDLEREFATLKQTRQLAEDELARLKIETDLRSLELLAAKVVIETEMESIKREQLALRTQVLPYESNLAQERLATARAKLAVIPYVKNIIAAEQLLLVANEANADRKEALVSEKELLADKKLELVEAKSGYADKMAGLILAKEGLLPDRQAIVAAITELISQKAVNLGMLSDKIAAMDEQVSAQLSLALAQQALIPKYDAKSAAWDVYLVQLENYISVKGEIAAVKEVLAELEMTEAEIKGEQIQLEIVKIAAKQLLQEARIALAEIQIIGDGIVLDARIADVANRLTGDQNILWRKTEAAGELMAKDIDHDEYIQGVKIAKGLEAHRLSSIARGEASALAGDYSASGQIGAANAKANAQITSSLIHILGS